MENRVYDGLLGDFLLIAAQKIELLLAEQSHAQPAIGPAKHRAQGQKQSLIKRVKHLFRLARVAQRRKILKKIKGPLIPSPPSSSIAGRSCSYQTGTTRITVPPNPLLKTHLIALGIDPTTLASF